MIHTVSPGLLPSQNRRVKAQSIPRHVTHICNFYIFVAAIEKRSVVSYAVHHDAKKRGKGLLFSGNMEARAPRRARARMG